MEVAAVVALAIFGYELSKSGRNPSRQHREIPKEKLTNGFPFETDIHPPTMEEHILNNNYNWQPANGMRGMGANNTETISKTKMETFTGNDDVFYKNKKECEPMFAPESGRGFVNGVPPPNEEVYYDQYKSSLTDSKMFQNVSPIEKMNIGPGLRTTETAKGGHHQYLRILPDSVNSYQKQTFQGRVVAGKAVTTEPSEKPHMETTKPETSWEYDRRPNEKSRAASTAAAARSHIDPSCTNRGNPLEHYGSLFDVRSSAPSVHDISITRSKDRTENCSYEYGNPQQQASGAGAYTNGTYLVHDTNRAECDPQTVLNAAMGNKGHTMGSAAPRMTTKETTAANCYTAPASSIAKSMYVKDIHYTLDESLESKAYVPGPQNMNVLQDPNSVMQNVIAESDENTHESLGPLKARGINNHTSMGNMGTMLDRSELGPFPDRADGVALSQLVDNPYAIKSFHSN